MADRLVLCPGHTVLDADRGPGADRPGRAERVGGRAGGVIGVDRDPVMLERARERTRERPRVELRESDVHALPVDPASVDRAGADRASTA